MDPRNNVHPEAWDFDGCKSKQWQRPSLLPCIRFYVYTQSEKAAVSFFAGCSELRFKIRFWHCSIQPGSSGKGQRLETRCLSGWTGSVQPFSCLYSHRVYFICLSFSSSSSSFFSYFPALPLPTCFLYLEF